MSCCENPTPRVLSSNGRMFCGSCRRYLDQTALEPHKEVETTEAETNATDDEERGEDDLTPSERTAQRMFLRPMNPDPVTSITKEPKDA